jgi:hypothetical protein
MARKVTPAHHYGSLRADYCLFLSFLLWSFFTSPFSYLPMLSFVVVLLPPCSTVSAPEEERMSVEDTSWHDWHS